jgi:hypothetical protein
VFHFFNVIIEGIIEGQVLFENQTQIAFGNVESNNLYLSCFFLNDVIIEGQVL